MADTRMKVEIRLRDISLGGWRLFTVESGANESLTIRAEETADRRSQAVYIGLEDVPQLVKVLNAFVGVTSRKEVGTTVAEQEPYVRFRLGVGVGQVYDGDTLKLLDGAEVLRYLNQFDADLSEEMHRTEALSDKVDAIVAVMLRHDACECDSDSVLWSEIEDVLMKEIAEAITVPLPRPQEEESTTKES